MILDFPDFYRLCFAQNFVVDPAFLGLLYYLYFLDFAPVVALVAAALLKPFGSGHGYGSSS